jgi:hypothetical protein
MASGRSFIGSVVDGSIGSIKGGLVGAGIGALAGAAIGTVITIATWGTGVGSIPALAILGASIMGSIGSTAGIVTGVVKGREAAQISPADVEKVAKVAFEHGVQVGQNVAPEQTMFRNRIEAERAAAEQAQSQRVH